MIVEPRKHLFATHIILFIFIWALQKLITLFCIIEQRACDNAECPPGAPCEGRCGRINESTKSFMSLKFTPIIKRQMVRNFGYGEGHYQMFVEERQRPNLPLK